MTSIDDLARLTLADGLPVEREGKTIRYREVRLRETTVADERAAARMAERVVQLDGRPTLMVSDSDFRYALTLRHIEAFAADGQLIPQAMLDLDTLGKLSSHDLGLIEQRVFLVELAAQVRYGLLTPEQFHVFAQGRQPQVLQAPQRGGQAGDVGAAAAADQPGPAMLADYAGDGAAGPAAAVAG